MQDREATSTRTTATIALEKRAEVWPKRQSSRRSATRDLSSRSPGHESRRGDAARRCHRAGHVGIPFGPPSAHSQTRASISVQNGKGPTRMQARAGAMMEAVEHYCCERAPHRPEFATIEPCGARPCHRSAQPVSRPASGYTETVSFEWLRGTDLIRRAGVGAGGRGAQASVWRSLRGCFAAARTGWPRETPSKKRSVTASRR